MKTLVLLLTMLLVVPLAHVHSQSAKEIIQKANDLSQGNTNESIMKMTVVRPTYTRTIGFKTWSKGTEFSMALISEPAKEKGQAFLKRQNEMWNWIPNIQRMVKLPPSMMSQGWMGSDFTNDELLKESSLVIDYTHTLLGSETVNNIDCYKIRLETKPEAAVVWGAQIKWISKDGFFQIKSEYYDEDMELVKTELAFDIKTLGDRRLPTRFELIPADKPGNKTIVVIESAVFDKPIADSFFSQQNMKNLR